MHNSIKLQTFDIPSKRKQIQQQILKNRDYMQNKCLMCGDDINVCGGSRVRCSECHRYMHYARCGSWYKHCRSAQSKVLLPFVQKLHKIRKISKYFFTFFIIR